MSVSTVCFTLQTCGQPSTDAICLAEDEALEKEQHHLLKEQRATERNAKRARQEQLNADVAGTVHIRLVHILL